MKLPFEAQQKGMHAMPLLRRHAPGWQRVIEKVVTAMPDCKGLCQTDREVSHRQMQSSMVLYVLEVMT